jgi:hypothetical protein
MTRFRTVPLNEVPTGSICEDKAHRLKQYADATLAFSNAVQGLLRARPKEEYLRLERVSHEARVKSEQTRLALELHVATHRC